MICFLRDGKRRLIFDEVVYATYKTNSGYNDAQVFLLDVGVLPHRMLRLRRRPRRFGRRLLKRHRKHTLAKFEMRDASGAGGRRKGVFHGESREGEG